MIRLELLEYRWGAFPNKNEDGEPFITLSLLDPGSDMRIVSHWGGDDTIESLIEKMFCDGLTPARQANLLSVLQDDLAGKPRKYEPAEDASQPAPLPAHPLDYTTED